MRALWVLLAIAACGDNVLVDPVTDAVSGTRIKVQRYRYDDGTEQTEPFEYYDTLVHTTCRAVTWADGIVRCGPVADAALYTDAACTTVVGRADTIEHPSHFVGSDVIDGVAVPTRVYTAGAEATAPASYFERQDGACAGPFPTPPEASYFEATEERSGDALQPLRDGELGAARLAVRTVETDDGLRVPVGFHDRSLVADCAPESRADGSVWCAPTDALAATRFADASCSAPVVVADTRPAFASISDAAGCASYAAVGEPVTAPLFRLDGDACVPAGVASGFAVGSPVELAPLERSLAPGGRRLSQIVLDTGDLQLHADELFDTATRADCRRQVLASETEKSDIVRCIPRTTDAQLLYTNGCVVGVLVAELPQRTCGSVGFATAPSETGLDVHAIGDPMGDALFEPAPFGCRPHVVPADATLHALGPALPPEAFVGAIYFGDR